MVHRLHYMRDLGRLFVGVITKRGVHYFNGPVIDLMQSVLCLFMCEDRLRRTSHPPLYTPKQPLCSIP